MYFLFGRKIRYIFLTTIIFLVLFFVGWEVKAATVVDCECKINYVVKDNSLGPFMAAGEADCTTPGTFNNRVCTGAIIKWLGSDSQVSDCSKITDPEKIKKGYFKNGFSNGSIKIDLANGKDFTVYIVSCTAISGSTGTGDSSTGGSSVGSGMTAASLMTEAAKKMNPGGLKSPQQLIGYAIKFDMAALGAIALGLYIWAGFLWMTSGGNSERRDKATKTLVWVTLGIIIMFASYLLMKFIFEQIILK